MELGFIGAGNMASALARGIGEPALVFDVDPDRARALAHELGGEAVASNAELAERAELLVLAHKPGQLEGVAAEMAATAAGKPVVSLLARTSLAAVAAAYPQSVAFRVMPNLAVEVGRGVTAMAEPGDDVGAESARAVRELFERAGTVVAVPDKLIDAASACSGVGPAYWALMVEAKVDAAVRRGLSSAQAAELVGETMAGSAELLRARGWDTLAVRREVASPGGTTAQGLAALERGGIRAAFAQAIDDVLERR